MPSARFGSGALLACAAMAAGSAHASGFDISPTRAVLDSAARVQTLRLHNSGAAALDFEVTVKRWQMTADGQWKLDNLSGPSPLVVHPLSFRVAPGQTQLLRVGLARAAPAGPEQAYRIFVRELPPTAGAGAAQKVGMLARLSLPVFVSDGSAKPTPSLEVGAISAGRWSYRLRSGDNGHLDPAKVSLRLFDAAGQLLSTQDVVHGYVLAGAALPVEVKLGPEACRKAVTFEFVAEIPLAAHKGVLPSGTRSCAS